MMIRSSSTPLLGSLLPSLSPENNHNNHHHHHNNHHDVIFNPYKSSPVHKFSFGSHLSCNSSPSFNSNNNISNGGGLRRAQSDGNLDILMSSCININNNISNNINDSNDSNDNINDGDVKDGDKDNKDDVFGVFNKTKKHASRFLGSTLETIPSFSYQNSRFRSDGDESESEEQEEEEQDDEKDYGFCGFNAESNVLRLNKQMGMKDGVGEMFLAKGLGVDGGFGSSDGGGGLDSGRISGENGGGGDGHDVEEHYRKMVNECPGNALLLGNYAQFLYQSKKDLQGAEEYYSRAILIDANDGEVLSQYAKLLWELHRDKERATTYFERAIQTASEDSHVHAAYASFLWETEEEEDEEEEGYYSNIPPLFNNGKMASAATA